MNNRERFLRVMRFQPVDHIPVMVGGIWADTMVRWIAEGYPPGADPCEYFGVEPFRAVYLGPNTGVWPPLPQRIIEENERFVVKTDGYGRTVRDFKDHTSMPEWLDFPVKTPADLERFLREHFDPSRADERWPADWEEKMSRWAGKPGPDTVLFLDGGCYYWNLRSLAGVEYASYLFYDAPELVDELFESINRICLAGMRRVLARTSVDYLGFGEDIAFKTSTLISPEMFDRHIVPRYRRVVTLAREHGLDLTWYDSDGNLWPFMDRYLELGINTFAPVEVAAGMDPVALRERYGRAVRLLGGFDKRVIARGPRAIDAEIERLLPVIREGGFIPYVDHSVSADISLANYRHFLGRLKEL